MRSLCAALLLGLAVLAGPASAALMPFWVNPAESHVQVQGSVTLDFGLPAGPFVMPLMPQTAPGTIGAALSGGGTSDGLEIAVDGIFDVEVVPVALPFPSTLRLRTREEIQPLASGSWLPGPPGMEGAPKPAQLAAVFEDAVLGFSGAAALRDLAFQIPLTALKTRETAPGFFPFPQPQVQGQPASPQPLPWVLASGVLDFETSLPGVGGRSFLAELQAASLVAQDTGSLADLGGGLQRLILPIDMLLEIGPEDLGIALPLFVQLQLGGTIVAYNQDGVGGVPEPAAAALLGVALAALAARRRARGGSA
jgi:hypothetical protein